MAACKEALFRTREIFGVTSQETAGALVNLATAEMMTGNTGLDTETMFLQAVRIYQDLAQTGHPDSDTPLFQARVAHFAMGTMHLLRGNFDAAEEAFRRGGFEW